MSNDKSTTDVIVWRGIRFERVTGYDRFHAQMPGDTWVLQHTRLDARWLAALSGIQAFGSIPEEALEAARSQVESIARAVGLIPDVTAQELLDATVAWQEYDERNSPRGPGFSTAPYWRFLTALTEYRKVLAHQSSGRDSGERRA